MLRGSIIVSNLALKWGQSISLGVVLYSTKWVKHVIVWLVCASHNTETHHNTTTLKRLGPSLSMGRAKLPQNHCAAAPLRVCAGCEPLSLRLPALFFCLGRQNSTHQKIEGKTWPQPYGAAVQLENITINQQSTLAGTGGEGREAAWAELMEKISIDTNCSS